MHLLNLVTLVSLSIYLRSTGTGEWGKAVGWRPSLLSSAPGCCSRDAEHEFARGFFRDVEELVSPGRLVEISSELVFCNAPFALRWHLCAHMRACALLLLRCTCTHSCCIERFPGAPLLISVSSARLYSSATAHYCCFCVYLTVCWRLLAHHRSCWVQSFSPRPVNSQTVIIVWGGRLEQPFGVALNWCSRRLEARMEQLYGDAGRGCGLYGSQGLSEQWSSP